MYVEDIPGAIYLLGFFIAVGLSLSSWNFSDANPLIKILRVPFLAAFSWIYVGYIIGVHCRR